MKKKQDNFKKPSLEIITLQHDLVITGSCAEDVSSSNPSSSDEPDGCKIVS